MVSWSDGRAVLVDTPPELRLQLLREGIRRIDAVWFTHVHADHLHGIDDLRTFSMRSRQRVPAFASEEARYTIERRFDYIFDPTVRPGPGSSKPQIAFQTAEAGVPIDIVGERFLPIEVPHGSMRVLGFRVGDLGYITDAKRLPIEAMELLAGVRVLVLNALWWGDPHPTHFNLEEAVETAQQLRAERTYVTHLTHRVSHVELASALPPGIFPAYDGLSVEVGEEDATGGLELQGFPDGLQGES
ncbi:MAG: MBL fold metallo-hydrolase [Gemmatimonadota bacterium]